MSETELSAEAIVIQFPRPAVLAAETIEPHRNIVQLRDWLAAQAPWRRGVARAVRERIREAA